MKLNQELIKRLTNGEIAYHHTGTNEDGLEILKSAFPKDHNLKIRENYGLTLSFYRRSPQNYKICLGRLYVKNIEIFTTEQFYEVETETTPERSERIPDVGKTISKIEFFKQVCASSYQLKSVQSFYQQIAKAWEFTEMVYEKINEISATDKD